ncbi:MAG: hypothetical protein LBC39_07315 [Methanobrevibacter sp.]|nr:hypothetical protein [Candidatus Methanovirga aequatorialis]
MTDATVLQSSYDNLINAICKVLDEPMKGNKVELNWKSKYNHVGIDLGLGDLTIFSTGFRTDNIKLAKTTTKPLKKV